MTEDEFCDLADMLAGQADALADITLATLPTFTKGSWGDAMCGMMRQPDGSYRGDQSYN
jgi:hypothetical protein